MIENPGGPWPPAADAHEYGNSSLAMQRTKKDDISSLPADFLVFKLRIAFRTSDGVNVLK